MKSLFTRTARDDRGLAGIEFALVTPVLLVLLIGTADFALAFWSRGVLASSVAQGAQYAFLAGPNVSASVVQGIVVQGIVGRSLSLPAENVTVTGPDCRCVSGTPAAAVGQACGQPCPDGRLPGMYLTISASYTYVPILPFYKDLAIPEIKDAATVRLR